MASSNNKPFYQMLLENFETKGDVTFSVGEPGQEEEIKASVYILRVASPVFDTMFNSTWNGQTKIIKLPDIRPDVFKNFLKLLVMGDLKERHIRDLKLSIQEVFDILYVTRKYDVTFVHSVCIQFLKTHQNAVMVYQFAGILNEVELENSAFVLIAKNAAAVFQKDEFLTLSRDSLARLLKSNDLVIQETLLFQRMCKWAEAQCAEKKWKKTGENLRKVLGELLFFIRFPLMSHLEFAKVVRPTQILSDKELVDLHDNLALPPSERKATIPFGGSPRSWKAPMLEIERPRKRSRFLRASSIDVLEESCCSRCKHSLSEDGRP